MAFCTQCGAKLEEGARYCIVCGARRAEPIETVEATARAASPGCDPTVFRAPEKKRASSKSLRLLFLVLIVAVALTAGAYLLFVNKSETLPLAPAEVSEIDLGLYTARRAERGSEAVDIDALWKDGFSIELNGDGSCRVNMDGEESEGSWRKESGGAFRLNGRGFEFEGTLRNGVLTLEDVMDSGMTLLFSKDAAPLQLPPAPAERDPVLGRYLPVRAESMGVEVPLDELVKGEFAIELSEDGKCSYTFEGERVSAAWTLEGESLAISGEKCLAGTLHNGVLTLENVGDLGVAIYLTKDGIPIELALAAAEGERYGEWQGDYYGYWITYNVSGRFEEEGYLGHYWDVCASLEVDGDEGSLRIWDEDGDYLADAALSFGPGLTEKGRMTTSGGFFYSCDLSGGVWQADPGAGLMRDYKGFIFLNCRYYETADNWVDYYIFLRPWGMDWEDVRTGDMSAMPYENMLPRHYEDWYLPLIEAGEPMPGDFSGLNAEKEGE